TALLLAVVMFWDYTANRRAYRVSRLLALCQSAQPGADFGVRMRAQWHQERFGAQLLPLREVCRRSDHETRWICWVFWDDQEVWEYLVPSAKTVDQRCSVFRSPVRRRAEAEIGTWATSECNW